MSQFYNKYKCAECFGPSDGYMCQKCCTHDGEHKNGTCLDCGADV